MVTGSLFLLPNFTAIIELVIFLLVMAFMAKVVLPVLQDAMRTRERRIAEDATAAEALRAEANRLADERRTVLQAARAEARTIVEGASAEADEIVAERRRQASEEAARMIEEATAVIASERDRLRSELLPGVDSLADLAAAKVLGDTRA